MVNPRTLEGRKKFTNCLSVNNLSNRCQIAPLQIPGPAGRSQSGKRSSRRTISRDRIALRVLSSCSSKAERDSHSATQTAHTHSARGYSPQHACKRIQTGRPNHHKKPQSHGDDACGQRPISGFLFVLSETHKRAASVAAAGTGSSPPTRLEDQQQSGEA